MNAQTIAETFNGLREWGLQGGYFQLLGTVNPVQLELWRNGNQVLRAADVTAGFYLRAQFDQVKVTTGAAEAVSFFVGPQEGGIVSSGGGLTDAQLRATPVPISGNVGVLGAVEILNDVGNAIPVSGTFWQATQPVSGPLTDAQLRATAVPVSGPLTDAQLRATAVPVSGPLTDAQLRASAVNVAAAGDVAHDAVDAGNPLNLGGRAIAGTLPAAVAGNDRVRAHLDVYGRLATRPTGTFQQTHAPAAAAQATTSKAAAGAGIKNVCTALSVSLASAAAPTVAVATFNLRDGATGAGTILWSIRLSLTAVAGNAIAFGLAGVWMEGTANTAMTLETAAAPAANVQATVALMGTLAQ